MESEEIFEIDRKINQIKRSLQQREERAVEWEVNVQQILKEKPNKDYYLSRKYGSINQSSNCNENDLLKKVQKSRELIRAYQNQLKELDLLLKKKNKIKSIQVQMKENQTREDFFQKENMQQKHTFQKDFNKTNYEAELKDHTFSIRKSANPLQTLKGEQLLELYQETKSRYLTSEESMVALKNNLSIGIENTPFYSWLKTKTNQANQLKNRTKSKPILMPLKENKQNICEVIQKNITNKQNIYFDHANKKGQQFQRRLMNIIQYHRKNVDSIKLS